MLFPISRLHFKSMMIISFEYDQWLQRCCGYLLSTIYLHPLPRVYVNLVQYIFMSTDVHSNSLRLSHTSLGSRFVTIPAYILWGEGNLFSTKRSKFRLVLRHPANPAPFAWQKGPLPGSNKYTLTWIVAIPTHPFPLPPYFLEEATWKRRGSPLYPTFYPPNKFCESRS